MSDHTDFLKIIKRAAKEAIAAEKPAALMTGVVCGTSPYAIQVGQDLILTESFLLFTQTAANAKLMEGDAVILLRNQGGQSYLVIDKKETLR